MGRHSIPDPEDSAEDQPGYPAEPQHGQARGRDQGQAGYDEYTADQYPADEYADDDYAADYAADDDDEPDYSDQGYTVDDYWPGAPARPRPPAAPRSNFGGGDDFDHRFDDDFDGGFDDGDEPTRSFATSPPGSVPPRPPASGPQHGGGWDGGEWTGSHRAITTKRRGVSKGVIAALATVVVVVAAVILWRFFGDALSSRSEVAAARCVSGDVAVAVIADPSISDQISTLAEEYNEVAQPVGDRCVKVVVTSADSNRVIGGFGENWPAELGERPALWIPGSSVSTARLEAAAGPQTVSASRSLVTSPVMLALRPELKRALGEAKWADLPALQTNPNALNDRGLQGWGSLKLALPLAGNADATYAAAEAVAAGTARPGAPASTGTGAVTTLVGAAPKLPDANAATAMDALLSDGAPAASPVHAVVTTEQQIYQRSTSSDGGTDQLAAWLPSGPTAVADFPAVQLAGDWLSREQISAASEFDRFLRKPESLGKLVAAGFRADADGAESPRNDVVDFGPLGAPVDVGDDEVRTTLADAVTAPMRDPVVTIVLDQSMDTAEGDRSRLANVTAALRNQLQAMPPNAAIGLWTFDGVAGRSEVPTGPLGDPVDGRARSAVLTSNLEQQTASSGGAVSFTTLRLLYTEAVANFREGQENSVLVITAGPHTDRSLDGPGLEAFIKETFSPARPVAVNVIDFGADSDRGTWEAVAQSTGGTYQELETSESPELAAALTSALR